MVVRLSGSRALEIATALAGDPGAPRRAVMRLLRDPSGDLIDRGIILTFKAPASFTGEDVVEFQLHGSVAVEAALYDALRAHGARPAERGEFTKRALLNGKLDLAEVEGLADLLEAETKLQRLQALGQLAGRLSSVAEAWRARLLAIMAPLEAAIDFPDEADIPAEIAARAAPEIDALIAALKSEQERSVGAMAIREGVKVAIIGAPNAGKSSLLNLLSGSERAIVSETPGTTRDVIEARLELGGMLASLFDTAGLRDRTDDRIEIEGIRRTRMTAEEADIRILMIDVSSGSFAAGSVPRETTVRELSADEAASAGFGLMRPGDIILLNKIDLIDAAPAVSAPGMTVATFSAKTRVGLDHVLGVLEEAVSARAPAEDAVLSRSRHADAVERAIRRLAAARERLSVSPELAAEDVRMAMRALGGITGAVDVEEVLGAIFSSFCVGK